MLGLSNLVDLMTELELAMKTLCLDLWTWCFLFLISILLLSYYRKLSIYVQKKLCDVLIFHTNERWLFSLQMQWTTALNSSTKQQSREKRSIRYTLNLRLSSQNAKPLFNIFSYPFSLYLLEIYCSSDPPRYNIVPVFLFYTGI